MSQSRARFIRGLRGGGRRGKGPHSVSPPGESLKFGVHISPLGFQTPKLLCVIFR
jgi:hypothetical protein